MGVSNRDETDCAPRFDEEEDIGKTSEQFSPDAKMSWHTWRRAAFRPGHGERSDRRSHLV
jgi:hypothetical protein